MNDVEHKQELVTQWQELTVKVESKDANATVPPGAPLPRPARRAGGRCSGIRHDDNHDHIFVGDRRPRRRLTPRRLQTSPSETTTTSPSETATTSPSSPTSSPVQQLPPTTLLGSAAAVDPVATRRRRRPRCRRRRRRPRCRRRQRSTPLPTPSAVDAVADAVSGRRHCRRPQRDVPRLPTPLPTPSAVQRGARDDRTSQVPPILEAPAPKTVVTTTIVLPDEPVTHALTREE